MPAVGQLFVDSRIHTYSILGFVKFDAAAGVHDGLHSNRLVAQQMCAAVVFNNCVVVVWS